MESTGGFSDEDAVFGLDRAGGIGDTALEMVECISIGNAKVCWMPFATNRSSLELLQCAESMS
jgi:hypothetical protein